MKKPASRRVSFCRRDGLTRIHAWRMDLRNHRKLAVIDRHIGYTGSQNLAEATFVPGYPNHEVVVRVQVPVVSQLGALFASDWYIETGEALAIPEQPPEIAWRTRPPWKRSLAGIARLTDSFL